MFETPDPDHLVLTTAGSGSEPKASTTASIPAAAVLGLGQRMLWLDLDPQPSFAARLTGAFEPTYVDTPPAVMP